MTAMDWLGAGLVLFVVIVAGVIWLFNRLLDWDARRVARERQWAMEARDRALWDEERSWVDAVDSGEWPSFPLSVERVYETPWEQERDAGRMRALLSYEIAAHSDWGVYPLAVSWALDWDLFQERLRQRGSLALH